MASDEITYHTEEEVATRLIKVATSISTAARNACVAALVDELCARSPSVDRAVSRDLLSDAYYAIRNDDLAVATELMMLAAAVVPALQPAALAQLVVLLFRYRRKRVRLTASQGRLLLEMKTDATKAWTSSVLATRLDATPDTIEALLVELTACRTETGLDSPCVRHENGSWKLIDV